MSFIITRGIYNPMIKTIKSFKSLAFISILILTSLPVLSNELKESENESIFSSKIISPIMLEARIDVPLELNLEKVLNIAALQNLDLIQSRYQKNINKWKLWENIGNWFPDYKLGLLGQRLDGQFLIGGVFPVMALTSNANAYMRFDYHFFEGGKGLFNTLAAKKLYKSADENLSASQKDIFLIVTKAYNQLLKEKAQLNVFAKSVEEAQSELELNKNLEKSGAGTKFDVLQSEAQLAEQEQKYIVQQSEFREASINLARILNLEQGIHIKPDEKDLIVKKLFDIDKPISEILSVAMENRSEIKKAQYEYSAQKYYIGSAYSAFLPRANFFGQFGGTGNVFFHRTKVNEIVTDAIRLNPDGSPVAQMVTRGRRMYQTFDPQVDLSDITNVSNVVRGAGDPFLNKIDDSLMTSKFLGVQIDWELADGLGIPTVSRINQARYQANLAKIVLNKINQNIEQEVRTAYLNVQANEKLLDVTKRRVNAASEALRLAKLRLENGVGINLELLNAQKQYADALASEVDAVINYNNSQAELLHSLGLITIESLI